MAARCHGRLHRDGPCHVADQSQAFAVATPSTDDLQQVGLPFGQRFQLRLAMTASVVYFVKLTK